MRGPRPIPVRLQVLRGNPGRRPLRNGFEPPVPPTPPQPPPFLRGYALEEWHRVAPGLHLLGLLSEVDVAVLSAYCISYQHWRTAEEKLAEVAQLDPAMHGLLVKGSQGQARSNPLVQIAREAASSMIRVASEFGFSPAARSRIAAGIGQLGKPAASKFAGLLAGQDEGLL